MALERQPRDHSARPTEGMSQTQPEKGADPRVAGTVPNETAKYASGGNDSELHQSGFALVRPFFNIGVANQQRYNPTNQGGNQYGCEQGYPGKGRATLLKNQRNRGER